MPLQFVKPSLPGSVVTLTGSKGQVVRPGFGTVVAIPITHDSGPEGSAASAEGGGARFYPTFSAFEADYGDGDTAGRDAVLGAFNGMGVEVGGGGAGGVYVYRMTTGAAAAAAAAVQNATPATALTLTAIYKGTRGNAISYVVEDDPVSSANDRLRILFRGATVETFSYPNTNVGALVAAINNRPSKYVRASLTTDGVALAVTSQAGTALAGGDNGASFTSSQLQSALDAFEFADFGIFAPANIIDVSLKAQMVAWQRLMAAEMRPIRAVYGGTAGESVDDALTDAALIRDPHVVRLGVGTYHDDLLDKDVSTAQLAPRAAGVLAARGLRAALTRAEFGGLTALEGAATDELVAARDGGVTVLRRVSSQQADLAVSQGVTTYIDQSNPAMPYDLWSEPRIVGLFDYIIRSMTAWGDDKIIGDVPVTDNTRADVRKEVGKLLNDLVTNQLAVPGTVSADTPVSDDPDLADAVPYTFTLKPTRTANYLIGQGSVS
jgi:hypothetical protein